MTDAFLWFQQSVIAICGMASIWLTNDTRESRRRWAPIIGLAAQPFWLWSSLSAGQYGIAALSVVYAAGWIRGIRMYWRRAC